MFTCKVDSTVFSTGYSKPSDSFIIASSNDLSQNTHMVISRSTNNQIHSAGDMRIVKTDGSFSIEELGATVFLANIGAFLFGPTTKLAVKYTKFGRVTSKGDSLFVNTFSKMIGDTPAGNRRVLYNLDRQILAASFLCLVARFFP